MSMDEGRELRKATGAGGRIASVDAFRAVAAFAVVAIHAEPFTGGRAIAELPLLSPAMVVNQIARFAVPMFFVLSGVFFARRLARSGAGAGRVIAGTLLRAGSLFAGWSIFYALPYRLAVFQPDGPGALALWQDHLQKLRSLGLLHLLLHGSAGHLWFLSSLVGIVAIAGAFALLRRPGALAAFGAAFFVVAVLSKAYALTPIGLPIRSDLRNGPFFGLVFFASGMLLARATPQRSWLGAGLALAGAGFVLQFCELGLLEAKFSTTPFQDFTFGTYAAGLGMAVAALSGAGGRLVRALAPLGPVALGIYGVHLFFVQNLPPAVFGSGPVAELAGTLLAFALSAAAAWLLARHRATAWLVR